MAALELWRVRVFNDFLPNTAYAKMGGGLWQYVRGARYAANFAHCFLLPFLPLLALALWEVGGGAARASSESRVRRFLALCRANPGATACASIALVYTTYIVSVGGDYMAMYRFFVPVLPFIYLSLVPPFDALLSSTGSGASRKRGALTGAVAIAALGTVFHSTPAERFFFPVPALQHGTYRGVQTERWNVARISLIGKYFAAHRKGPHDSVATNTIGCLGYYAPDIVVEDLNGLTDKYIAHRNVSGMGHGWAGHEKTDLDYSFHRLPTYFVLDRFFAGDDVLRAGSSLSAVADALAKNYPGAKDYARWIHDHPDFIREHYRIVTTWLEDPENHEQGYFAYLERQQ
jgi:hypothetical protein